MSLVKVILLRLNGGKTLLSLSLYSNYTLIITSGDNICMLILNKNIVQLVDENYIYARALNYLGIQFMEVSDKTLIQVCRERSINVNKVLKIMNSFLDQEGVDKEILKDYPTSLIIGYLKHSHQTFIKKRLPYINELIQKLQFDVHQNNELDDLNLIFPVFLEDFIKHIYEEEDTLFDYILDLDKFNKQSPKSVSNLILKTPFSSIIAVAEEHREEDEMKGLREMIACIRAQKIEDVLVKTIIKELQAFDEELNNHASIENDILFPKAIMLESDVAEVLANLSRLN